MSITSQMLACAEIKQLMKAHASYLYAWANDTPIHASVPEPVQEALLDVCARLYELIEKMPLTEKKVLHG